MKLIYTILLLWSISVNGQRIIIDSLSKFSYSQLKNSFDSYNNNKISEQKVIAKYYLQKAKKEKNKLQIAEGYILIIHNEIFPTALKYVDSIASVTKNIEGSLYPTRTYLIRGNLYFKHDYLKKALDNYIIALQYAKDRKDEKQITFANINIAFLNNYLGKRVEAAKTFRYYLYGENNVLNEFQYNQIRVSLIRCYIELNKLDSARFLIKEGQSNPFTSKNKYNIHQYLYFSGCFDLKQKEYALAIDKLTKTYNFFSGINDNNAHYSLYNLGKACDGLKNKEKAIHYFTLLDRNIQKTDFTIPQLREVYTYLIDYYKEKGDKEKQIYYIDRFLKVDKKLDDQFWYLSKEIQKKYDTPNLLEEKETIINELKYRKRLLYACISILLTLLLLGIFLYYKAKKVASKHRKIAQDLIHRIEKRNQEFEVDEKREILEIQIQENKELKNTPEDITVSILKELDVFEKKQLFLKNGITLAGLAKRLKTNTSYLSETINNHKGKNFASYLNDLRIDYVLEKLVKDKKFRSYKLPVVAEEIGYNNVQAFSVAFKKKTGTTPSAYIKEIDNSMITDQF